MQRLSEEQIDEVAGGLIIWPVRLILIVVDKLTASAE